MKKMSVFLMLAAFVAVLSGCPTAPNGMPIPVVTDSPAAGGQNDQSVVVGQDEGLVIVSGSFSRSAEKSVNLNDVVDDFIGHAVSLRLSFWPNNTYPEDMGKGGGCGGKCGGYGGLYFDLPIVDGEFYGEIALRAGEYSVYADVYDAGYNQLFWASSEVKVTAGESSQLDLLFQLPEFHNFVFRVPALPGMFQSYGEADIVTVGGEVFSAYYYVECWECPMESSGDGLIFSVNLPIGFSGADSDAEMLLVDVDGNTVATKLDFDIFNVNHDGTPFVVDYTPAEDIGGVEVQVGFMEYPDPDQGKG